MAKTGDMRVLLDFEDRRDRMSLDAFFAENADMDAEQRAAIKQALSVHGEYIGGGGAGPLFTLTLI